MTEYTKTIEEVLTEQGSNTSGLAAADVADRQEKFGKNKLSEGKKKSLAIRIFEQVRDPMIVVLIAAAVVSGLFNEIADMVIILVVIVLNAVLGIVQESKAEKAIEALQKMSAPHSKVRRDGKALVISSDEIVPGDIVLIEAGDSVPADLRLLEVASLKIEEAPLTGESVPVEKQTAALDGKNEDVPLGDRTNMAYMGTSVAYGRGVGVVTAIGMQTEMGKIASILSTTDSEKTPLQKKLASLSRVLSFLVLGICVFIFAFSMVTSSDRSTETVFEALLGAVSLAVAAIPEGLVVVVTVLLSIGVTRMSERNAIIRRLTAVETLGSANVICSDKTGTLTQNKMTVTAHFGDEKTLAKALALCSDAKVGDDGSTVGDPTEIALVEFARSLEMKTLDSENPRVAEAPFDSVRKMMSTINKSNDELIQYTKGAPDEVLKHSTAMLRDGEIVPLTDEMKQQILAENKAMADKALRVLAGAFKKLTALPENLSPESIENELVFVGLVGMIDPIRPEVKLAIDNCKNAGIRAVMITGDHKDTAVAIARELGILTDDKQAITGSELNEISDSDLERRISDICVYARVQPEHKVRIVNAWRKKGSITAMTGDGVNDAPALKSADIGIGMGITGTDVTKNVADMVLSDDNFASIIYAVEEGRRIYENIRKAIQFLLASNLSEVVSIFVATLLGYQLFAPIHILWINLVTDTFPAMALGMEKSESDSMKKAPRDKNEGIFADGLGVDVVWQGVLIGGLTLLSFLVGMRVDHITGMTMAFLTLSLCEVFHAFNLRSRDKSIFEMRGHNKFLYGAMLLSVILTFGVIYIPGLNSLFRLTPLLAANFLEALGCAIIIVPIVEIVKLIKRTIKKRT